MLYLLVNDFLNTMTIGLLFLLVLLHIGFWNELVLLGQCWNHSVLIDDVSIVFVFILPFRSDLLLTRFLLWPFFIAKWILS